MFRLPTHLESLVPPPRDQVPQSQPWRGAILLPASSPAAHPAAPRTREIRVTAAEIENDNQQEVWPRAFYLQVIARRGILHDVRAWLSQLQPSTQVARCMLMPDRLPDQASTSENRALFEAFAQRLRQDELVAIAPWDAASPMYHGGGGLLLYPTSTTHSLLVGVVFLNAPFPEFLQGSGLHGAVAACSSAVVHNVDIFPRKQQQAFEPSPSDHNPPNIYTHTTPQSARCPRGWL